MSRAVAIEQTVFVEFNNQSGALYKTKMRRLYLNLKEKTNPELRRDILEGELSTGKFCTMSNAVSHTLL